MKRFRSLIALVLTAVFLLGMFPLTLGAADTDGTGGTYTKKVVSVLYDNSGSMNSTGKYGDWRHEYAYYSIQMLAALLNERDSLVITPLNKGGLENTSILNSHEIRLDLADREQQIKNALAGDFLKPNGTTPYQPIAFALKHLTDRGMTTSDKMSAEENVEYWLFVMSDGDFTSVDQDEMQANFADLVKGYNNFQMVYMGMGDKVANLEQPTNSALAAASNFTGYHVKDVSTVVKTMQGVANQISGRYTAKEEDQLYTVSGNKVTVHLNRLDYAVRNLSIMLQSAGTDQEITLVKATHGQKDLSVKQPCVIKMNSTDQYSPKLKGYSAVIQDSAGFLSGGDLVLEFSDTVNSFSLMVEPALRLRTIIQRKEGDQWINTDRHYINGNMLPGQQIRALYEVYSEEANQAVDPNAIFTTVVSKVTYAGKEYKVGDPMPLQLGNHEIGVSVTADGSYHMYGSFSCIVAAKPTAYRAEGSISSADGGLGQIYDLSFTVYANDKKLNQSGLASYQYTVKGTDASGAEIPVTASVASDGTVSARVNLNGYAFGTAAFTFRVTDPDGFQREVSLQAQHIPASVGATVTAPARTSLTQYAWKQNTGAFVFQGNCAGTPVDFGSDFCGYQLTVGGRDVTDQCTVQGQQILFVPNETTLGDLLQQVGTVPILFKIYVKSHPTISDTVSSALEVTPTVYTVYSQQSGGTISPFELRKSDARVRISVERDGQFLSEEELWALYQSGELKVKARGNFIHRIFDAVSSYRVEYTTKTVNGVAYLVATPAQRHPAAVALFTTLALFPGDRNVEATYKTATAASAFHVDPPNPWSYIWRFLVLLLVIHILMLIMFCKTVTRFKPGTYVKLTIKLDSRKRIKEMYGYQATPVGRSLFSKILWKRIYTPFVGWFGGKQKRRIGGYELHATKWDNPEIYIPRTAATEKAFIASMGALNRVYPLIQEKIAAGTFSTNDRTIIGQPFPFDAEERLHAETAEEDGLKTDHLTSLNGIEAPIVFPASYNKQVFTFVFFVSDGR